MADKMLSLFVVWFCWSSVKGETVEVDTTSGRLLGLVTESESNGERYYSFRGIRYAEPPRRFEPAEPKQPWTDVYNATFDRPICINVAKSSRVQSEDCLFINVYTPKLPSNGSKLLPVMFWIYGGAFIDGSSQRSDYSPDYFIDAGGVVIVSLNYRLGIYGFLSTGTSRLPGNNGLKDIILGLQWVQQNIKFFNGDPKQVTMFGESAGAALTSYLTISPLTAGKGYFIRAICESGNALSPWALQRHPTRNYHQVLLKSGCYFLSIIGLDLYCLRHVSTAKLSHVQKLVLGINAVVGIDILNGISFSPVYEENCSTAALVNGAYSILKNDGMQNVSFIMGVNSEEGMALHSVLPLLRPIFAQADLFKNILVPEDMYASDSNKRKYIIPAIRKYYFENGLVLTSTDNNIIRFISDAMFNKPFREYLTLVQNRVPNYCYKFTYAGNPSEDHPVQEYLERVGHAEELSYLWRGFVNVTLSEADLRVKDKMVRMWTNFAKTGNPTPDENDPILDNVIWPQSNANGTQVSCLSIDEQLVVIRNPKEEGYRMWKNLYETYGKPKDTY